MEFKKTDRVKAILGVYSEYDEDIVFKGRYDIDCGIIMVSITRQYQKIAEKNFNKLKELTGKEIYISAVITPNMNIYREALGCPEGGEATFSIECTRNPEFIKEEDSELYIEQAYKNILDLKEYLMRSTVMIEFNKVDCVYKGGK